MYRIAILDEDLQTRRQVHLLAARFFEARKESAAFAICESVSTLPEGYDCYLRGDAQTVSLLHQRDQQSPWEGTQKPLEPEDFLALLARWRDSV